MHELVRRQSLAAVELERAGVHVGTLASRFLHDHHPRRRIPRIEVELPKSIETPAGNTAQIKCSRSGAPHSMRTQSDLMIEKNIRILMPLMARETGRDQALRQIVDFGNMNALLVQIRATSFFGGKKFVASGIVDHSCDHLPLVLQRHRDTEHRKAVREIRGSVERIDIPAILAARVNKALFLAQNIDRKSTRLNSSHSQISYAVFCLK